MALGAVATGSMKPTLAASTAGNISSAGSTSTAMAVAARIGISSTAVAVFLAGTATKVAVYLLIRIHYSVFGPTFGMDRLPVDEFLLVLSIAAMIVASFSAIYQQNTKRLLAYSSVAQIGYITLGVALANPAGLTGGIVHMFNHGVMKAALFMALGAVFYRTGSVLLADMAGIGRRMPVTMAVFTVAGLGLIGLRARRRD